MDKILVDLIVKAFQLPNDFLIKYFVADDLGFGIHIQTSQHFAQSPAVCRCRQALSLYQLRYGATVPPSGTGQTQCIECRRGHCAQWVDCLAHLNDITARWEGWHWLPLVLQQWSFSKTLFYTTCQSCVLYPPKPCLGLSCAIQHKCGPPLQIPLSNPILQCCLDCIVLNLSLSIFLHRCNWFLLK